MSLLERDILDVILSYLPDVRDVGATMSHRRNKGLVISVAGRVAVRKLDLEFFNSGINDGLPSTVIREAVILRGRLKDHPNIVSLLHLSAPTASLVRMVYPLLEHNLRQFMELSGSLPVSVVRDVSHQIFRGLAFAHSKQVVHRNIRLENILVSVHGGSILTVQLGDWTSARTVSSFPDRRCPLTPEESRNRPQTDKERSRMRYKAPEILLRLQSCPFAADVWSAGVCLLEIMLNGSLPWAHACSEQEMIFAQYSTVGTPDVAEWPEGSLCLNLRCGPRFPKPPFDDIVNKRDFLLSEKNGVWEKLKLHHGSQAVQFLSRLLDPIPRKRPSAPACLSSPFVLGITHKWDYQTTPEVDLSRPPESPLNRPLVYSRMEVLGGCIFRLSRILDSHTSKPVHLAISIFESLWRRRKEVKSELFPLIVSCLKVAVRFYWSKDMFKQISCSEIVTASDRSISESEIVDCEQFILNHIDSITNCFDTTVIDVIETLGSKDHQVSLVAQYIADVCLLDDKNFSRYDISMTHQATACIVLACQWLGKSPAPFLHDSINMSIDTLQIAVSATAQSVSETAGRIAIFDDGLLDKIMQWNYRMYIPKHKWPVWRTSRSYIESLVLDQDKRRISNVGATPPKPLLLRRSTIEHAAEWAIESRRKKRSLSLTPKRNPKRFREEMFDENAAPSNIIPEPTPRRSIRLSLKNINPPN